MVLATSIAATALTNIPVLVVCIILIGFFTGFYLVPLFSLLQHRAPKTSKGDSIATSNFINITGAIAASLVFATIDWTAVKIGFAPPLTALGDEHIGILTEEPEYKEGHPHRIFVDAEEYVANEKGPNYVLIRMDPGLGLNDEVAVRWYSAKNVTYLRVQSGDRPGQPIYDKQRLPAALFLSAGSMTLFTLGLLLYFLPDLFQRTRIWFKTRFRLPLEVAGMLQLPASGPVIVVTDARGVDQSECVVSATDRVTHLLLTGEKDMLLKEGRQILAKGGVVGVSADGTGPGLLEELLQGPTVPILPVHYTEQMGPKGQTAYVIAGTLLTAGLSVSSAREELTRVSDDLQHRLATGEPLEKESVDH
jgi:MFS family permease